VPSPGPLAGQPPQQGTEVRPRAPRQPAGVPVEPRGADRHQPPRTGAARYPHGPKELVILLDGARCKTGRHHPEPDRDLQAARGRRLHLPGGCTAAREPASGTRRHRSYAACLENEVRPRSHEIRYRDRGSITVWFGRLPALCVLNMNILKEFKGLEFDWYAKDLNGDIAVFCTAGEGILLETVINNYAEHNAITDVLETPNWGSSLVWDDLAKYGLYVFDWELNKGTYVRVAKPMGNLTEELKKNIIKIRDLPVLDFSFSLVDEANIKNV
jgi:hypothetical protein